MVVVQVTITVSPSILPLLRIATFGSNLQHTNIHKALRPDKIIQTIKLM